MTGHKGKGRHHVGTAALVVAATLCLGQTPAGAAPTASATRIANTANATFTTDAGQGRIASNTVTLTVDQVIEAAISATAPAVTARPSITPVGFVVSNPGNATERYSLSATVDVAGVEIAGIAVDSDGNGNYDAATDAILAEPALTLGIAERRTIFVLVRDADRTVTVTTTTAATRGHGAPGTVIVGAGDAGVDAVVGGTGAQASATSVITGDGTSPTLWKSQTVLAPNGTARVMPGAVVTYQIEARFPGPVRGPQVTDAIPNGLEFVPGSLTLDGLPLSDVDGDDAGSFDGTQVSVTLGDVIAAGTRVIRFKTTIR